MAPRPGSSASATLRVSEADTAMSQRTGDVPVLSTPRVVALAEEASVRAVQSYPDAATDTRRSRVALEAVGGRRLVFRVTVNDARGLIAAGRITRVVVERDRFLERTSG